MRMCMQAPVCNTGFLCCIYLKNNHVCITFVYMYVTDIILTHTNIYCITFVYRYVTDIILTHTNIYCITFVYRYVTDIILTHTNICPEITGGYTP